MPYQPAREKRDFRISTSTFCILLSFSAIPTGFLTFCLPADEATAKSVTKYSPTDSEKQTAVDCKDTRPRPCCGCSLRSQRCVFSVCDTDNMNSNATNKTRTGPKRVRTQEPEEEQDTQKSPPSSTPSSPTKAAKYALELAVASLPTSLQPLILHFGNQIITARCKRYAKKSIMQRMEDGAKYIPRSTKATDFKITLSAGAKEDEERVSFFEQQIQQAKDSYESSLKSVNEECIALEIQAAKKVESQLIMDLFPAIGKAIQQLQGTNCDARLQTVNALKMTPALLEYGPIENIINFLHFHQNHHTLDECPKATIRTMESEYATVAERTEALQYHTASLQRPENSGIQLYIKCLEGILVTPTAAYDKQVDENKRLLNVKKLSNEIIMGKTTEDTVMELDGEGAADFEQLQDLIRKECDKCDRKYAKLEDKGNKLEQQVKNPQKTCQRGAALQITKNPAPQEKQIKSKEHSKTTTESLKKHSRQQLWSQKQAKPRKPRTSRRKNNDSKQKSTNKRLSPSQSKSTRNPPSYSGKKKPPKRQQRRTNCAIWIRW